MIIQLYKIYIQETETGFSNCSTKFVADKRRLTWFERQVAHLAPVVVANLGGAVDGGHVRLKAVVLRARSHL